MSVRVWTGKMWNEFELIRQIQEFFGLGARPVFWFGNFLWGLGLDTLLPAMMFWLGSRKIGYRAGLFTEISGITGGYTKYLVCEPRPFYVSDAFAPLKVSTGFGMPSGNAQGIATLMMTIALYARRFWLWILAAFLILLVGLARVYFGVHSPSQVLVGWVTGIAIALLLFKIADPFISWFGARSLGFQIGFNLIVALVLGGIGVTINHLVLQNFETPEAWVQRYNELAIEFDEEDPFSLFSPYDGYAIGAWMLGLGLAGIFLLRDWVPEIQTRSGKVLNAGMGLGIFYGFKWLAGFIFPVVRGTTLGWPWFLFYCAVIPMLIYTVTPWATSRLLSSWTNDQSKNREKRR